MDKPNPLYQIEINNNKIIGRFYNADEVDAYIEYLLQGVQFEDDRCPMCGAPNPERNFHHLPNGVTVFGLNYKQLIDAIRVARAHGLEK